MSNPNHKLNKEELMAFLLGELEEAETSRIEAMFLDHVELEEDLESAKTELFSQYKSGAMSHDRSGRFEKRFLQESLKSEKREFREMLAKNAAERSDPESANLSEVTSVPEKRDPKSQPLAANRGATSRRTWVAVAALVLLISGAAFGYLRGNGGTGVSRVEVTLPAFEIRGKSQVISLPVTQHVDLLLPTNSPSFSSYEAVLFHGSDDVVVPIKVRDGSVSVSLDVTKLSTGRYDLQLTGIQDGGRTLLGFYSFQK